MNSPMHSDHAITVKNLEKTFRIFSHPGDRIKQALTFGKISYHREFIALHNISFEIKKGEAVGIIGHNGSGKSSLLQIICGILKPTTGTIRVNGRISALLELGSGFNPEFTGRENIYFQGVLFGYSKNQMDERIGEIIAFADIDEYIDQPVRTYSSGMFVRLAFAVAINVEPDLLVVDEALSVGDMAFQHKSKKRVQQLIDAGATLLLVSHDRSMITSTCSRCILLEKGKLVMDGPPADVFDYYYASIAKGNESLQQNSLASGRTQIVSGTGEARVEGIRLLDIEGNELGGLTVGMSAILEFAVRVIQPIPRLVLAFAIRDRLGQIIFNTNTNSFGKSPTDVPAQTSFSFKFQFSANIGIGSYSVSTFLVSTNDRFTDNFETRELAYFFEVLNSAHPYFVGSAWINPSLTVHSI
jgi:lipopolysaccharide transport system ATP-binding protein